MRLTWDVAVCDGHRAWLPTVPPHYLLHDAMRCPGCTVTFIPELPAAGPSPEPAAGEAAGASTAGKRSAPAATPTSDTGGATLGRPCSARSPSGPTYSTDGGLTDG